jgi:hypothetical protein
MTTRFPSAPSQLLPGQFYSAWPLIDPRTANTFAYQKRLMEYTREQEKFLRINLGAFIYSLRKVLSTTALSTKVFELPTTRSPNAPSVLKELRSKLMDLEKSLKNLAYDYLHQVQDVYEFQDEGLYPLDDDLEKEKAGEDIEQKKKDKHNVMRSGGRMLKMRTKPKKVFVFGMFMMDFVFLYFLKFIRIAIQLVALWAAQKSFQDMYFRKVYGKDKNPPHLRRMLYLYLSIESVAYLLVIAVVIGASFAFKREKNTFVIDDALIKVIMWDFILNTIVTLAFGIAVASTLYNNKYFTYKDQGLATTRAYMDIMMVTVGIIGILPLSLLLH